MRRPQVLLACLAMLACSRPSTDETLAPVSRAPRCSQPEAPPPTPPLPRTTESIAQGYNALHIVEEHNAQSLKACATALRALDNTIKHPRGHR